MRVRVGVRANLGHGDVEVVQAARQQPTLDTRLGEDGLDGRLVRRGRASAAARERVERGQQGERELEPDLLRVRASGEG